ncbi:hypothetical protein EON65_56020 [archaeon]|nr:MAG: hypothetical protein EON65_56020 [archaeon]
MALLTACGGVVDAGAGVGSSLNNGKKGKVRYIGYGYSWKIEPYSLIATDFFFLGSLGAEYLRASLLSLFIVQEKDKYARHH